MFEKMVDGMVNMRKKETLEIAKALVDGGEDPFKILDD
jgi:methanogenic corrinoid protein MtbC1